MKIRTAFYFPNVLLAVLLTVEVAQGSLFPSRIKPIEYEGLEYVQLRNAASHLEMDYDRGDRIIRLSNSWCEMEFAGKKRQARVNGVDVWLHRPVTRVRGRWSIALEDYRSTISPLLNPEDRLHPYRDRIIVLDPGHGGKDKGTHGYRDTLEKKLVLDISKRVRQRLVQEGYRVFLTREFDRYILLDERCRMAANWKADLFVSIHLNSAGNRLAEGVETFVLSKPGAPSTTTTGSNGPSKVVVYPGNRHDDANMILGYHLQRNILRRTKAPDRGVRRARFAVLKQAPCPSALIECGFLSNDGEEQKLLLAEYRNQIADGITQGIMDYSNAARRSRALASERTLPLALEKEVLD